MDNKGITVIHRRETLFVPFRWVSYFKSSDKYTDIVTKGETYIDDISLVKVEAKLDSEQFMRIHRNCIVRKSKIQSISKGKLPVLKLFGFDVELKVSRRHVAVVRAYIKNA